MLVYYCDILVVANNQLSVAPVVDVNDDFVKCLHYVGYTVYVTVRNARRPTVGPYR